MKTNKKSSVFLLHVNAFLQHFLEYSPVPAVISVTPCEDEDAKGKLVHICKSRLMNIRNGGFNTYINACSTAYQRQLLFLRKMSCLGWDSNPRHSTL